METNRDYAEEMFDAIQTIIDGSLQSLNYDETITCTIVDNSNRARGEYIVDDGSSTFIAYSDFTSYANDTSVYVTIPQGNYDNKKIILGRRTSQDSEYYNYVAPTESYVDITSNVLTTKYDSNGNEEIFSILANGELASKGPIYTWEGSLKGYDRIGVKASFRTYLNQLKPIAGSYGLYIKILHSDEITKEEQTSNFLFGQNEMYGNIYNFNTFFEQEAVYDISAFDIVKRIDIYLYQLQDFKSQLGDGAEIADVYIPHQETLTIGGQSSTVDLEDNIFVSNLYLSFGYDLKSFTEDKVINYTLDSMEYSSSNTNEERKRKLQCRWVHKVTENEIVSVHNQDGLDKYNGNLYWYHYVLDDEIESRYGGKYWQEIDNTRNKFENEVVCQTTVQDEYYKAVIVTLSQERINYIQNLKNNLLTYDIFAKDDELVQQLLLELDKFELKAPKLIDTEEYLNQLDKELAALSADSASKIEEIVKNNSYTLEQKREKIQEYYNMAWALENKLRLSIQASEKVDEIIYNDLLTAVKKQHELQEIYDYDKQEYQVDIVKDILKELLRDNTNDKQVKFLESAISTWESLPLYDQYEEILTIHNTTMVQANLAVDLVQAITIEVGDKDGRNGVYNIYGEDGQILNRTYSMERHKLILNYNSLLTGMSQFDGNGTEIVTWKIPLTNTMIQTPTDGIEYDSSKPILEGVKDANGNDIPSYKIEGEFIYIRRVIGNVDQDVKIGGFLTKTTEQIFRIKDYYSAVGNNTIYCSVEKGGYTYGNSITLIFGTAGTNGTDYTFRISLSENAEHGTDLLATPKVYDYNNQAIAITEIVQQKWHYPEYSNGILKWGNPNENQQFDINVISPSNGKAHCFNILETKIRIGEITSFLSAYTIIPWTSNIETYNHYEGPDRIVYNSQGTNPAYYKGNLKLYNHLDEEQTGIVWSIQIGDGTSDLSDSAKFYPTISENDGKYSLKVPSMFMDGNDACCIVAKINDNIVWYQPLLIIQNKYSSALLNNWNGDLMIDEENGTIMTPMLGAGKKNSDNSFSGVLIGDIARANDSINQTGVYGYDHGIQSYSLTEDGRATFGSAGRGQIIFDGNKGTIESGNHKVDKETGMEIDLEEGHIDAYNFKLNSRYVKIDSTPDAHNYFTIKGSGTVTQTIYTYGSDGTLDLTSDVTITVPNSDGTSQQISGQNSVYEIQDWPIENKTLMNIGNSSFYLQTLNYSTTTGMESGLRLDLSAGKLTAYDGFKLKATNHMVRIENEDAEIVEYPQMYDEVHADSAYRHSNLKEVTNNNYKNYYFKDEREETTDTTYHNDWENVEEFKLFEDANITEPTEFNNDLTQYYYKLDIKYAEAYVQVSEALFPEHKSGPYYRKIVSGKYKIPNKDNEYSPITKLYKLYTTKTYASVTKVNSSEIEESNKYGYIDGSTLKITSSAVSDHSDYYLLQSGKTYYYWVANTNPEAISAWTWNNFKYDGTTQEITLSSKIDCLYTKAGSYYRGDLTIDATANEYPIRLELGDSTPFKLSWAGYLNTSKLKATGGTIGGWTIEEGELKSAGDNIRLVSRADLGGGKYGGAIVLGNGKSQTKYTYIQYSAPPEPEKMVIDYKANGGYSANDIGKYVVAHDSNNNEISGKYFIIRSSKEPYYYYTPSFGEFSGGVYFDSTGEAQIQNLQVEGGSGYWGGTSENAHKADYASTAQYSYTTNPKGHTHTISGSEILHWPEREFGQYIWTGRRGGILTSISEIAGDVEVRGNTTDGIKFIAGRIGFSTGSATIDTDPTVSGSASASRSATIGGKPCHAFAYVSLSGTASAPILSLSVSISQG